MAKPAEWERVTARAEVGTLAERERQLVREAALLRGIETDPLADGGEGVRTESTSLRKGGLFRKNPRRTTTTALIAGELLLVLTGERDERPAVLIYRLADLDIAEYASRLIEDTGVEITGATLGGTERTTLFLPLDDGTVGGDFRTRLHEAAAR